MNNVNKTLYIPLYGKAYVSKKGIILCDKKAEEIWNREGFVLKGKAKSKWLAYNMGMRSAVFDNWLREKMSADSEAVILHIGCGMDSRIDRIGTNGHMWYDIDFPDVIEERRKYYAETDLYRFVCSDARENGWLDAIPKGKNAIIVMEGVSMYFKPEELKKLLRALGEHFARVSLLTDCYSVFAAKATKYKNPINDVGVTVVYGVDSPEELEDGTGLSFVSEHDLTPKAMTKELHGAEGAFFRFMFCGSFAKKIYRLYEYKTTEG